MPFHAHQCPQDGDSAAEDYVMELLSERDSGAFEEHLLVCEPCRARVAEAAEYVLAMKRAAVNARNGLN